MLPAERAVAVVLHDVAPETWPACECLLREVDALGPIPLTLLVVPEYHRGGSIETAPAFLREIETRMARGDEVAMHGCFHWDDLPVDTPTEWARRRVYTASEGEFAALGEALARLRLMRGQEVFRRLGWPLTGFVPPAWLMSAEARRVLTEFPFSYTSTRSHLYSLPDWTPRGAGSLFWSVRSRLRRRAFGLFNRGLLRYYRDAPLLRFGLHPVDAFHPDVVAAWLGLLREALAQRVPVTKAEWIEAGKKERGTAVPSRAGSRSNAN